MNSTIDNNYWLRGTVCLQETLLYTKQEMEAEKKEGKK